MGAFHQEEESRPPDLLRRVSSRVKTILLDLSWSRREREWRRARSVGNRVEGWLSPDQERWLFEQAYALPDEANIVEVGSFRGRSTCFLASGCRGTKKKVFAVDTFDGEEKDFGYRGYLEDFSRSVTRAGLSEYVQPLRGVSWEVAAAWDRPIHLLFVDGSHEYEDVLRDFRGFAPHVAPGGTIAFHDVEKVWPGPLRAWHEEIKHQLIDIGYCSTLAHGRKAFR
jgi:predicted O-methyltransferase YrrM